MSVTNTEFNGHSFAFLAKWDAVYILAKIQLSVICTHMIDFCRPSHNYCMTLLYYVHVRNYCNS